MIRLARNTTILTLTTLLLVACANVTITSAPFASPTLAPTATPTPTMMAFPSVPTIPGPTIGPAIGNCDPADLSAQVTSWENTKGQQRAHVELRLGRPYACMLEVMAHPQIVDGKDAVLIDGVPPAISETLFIGAGDVLKTVVTDANYCGPWPPAPPVSVAFIWSDGSRIVATAYSQLNMTTPPCKGAAGSPGTIEMTPWVL